MSIEINDYDFTSLKLSVEDAQDRADELQNSLLISQRHCEFLFQKLQSIEAQLVDTIKTRRNDSM